MYLLILDKVRNGEGTGYLYLGDFNFGVVLPVLILILGGAIAFGLDPGKVEKFRKDKKVMMRYDGKRNQENLLSLFQKRPDNLI